jgi:hypothetical protein
MAVQILARPATSWPSPAVPEMTPAVMEAMASWNPAAEVMLCWAEAVFAPSDELLVGSDCPAADASVAAFEIAAKDAVAIWAGR